MDVQLKTRGHWRLKPSSCDFTPIRVEFPKKQPEGSPFHKQGHLKLITHCKSKNEEYEQYVLREYLVYKVQQRITPLSFRVRLSRATYIDASGKLPQIVKYAFFLEDDGDMAKRQGAKVVATKGARFADLDDDESARFGAFQYLIGGTDFAVVALHNVRLIQNAQNGFMYPVAYDFDWSGLVNTKYSFPDERLGIRSVRERTYSGPCRAPDQWPPILDKFRQQKDSIYATYRSPTR